ncbi:unnamed protein product [Protopolystoma xenopodis]|uniref:Uncharacterized protein n=1 Tax=Protopolystoma xenopodis TaxID=117903 RepID=A0A3S5B637_9PLAT|nr:unnamed protein product [Protopolystoma xenopodis]
MGLAGIQVTADGSFTVANRGQQDCQPSEHVGLTSEIPAASQTPQPEVAQAIEIPIAWQQTPSLACLSGFSQEGQSPKPDADTEETARLLACIGSSFVPNMGAIHETEEFHFDKVNE